LSGNQILSKIEGRKRQKQKKNQKPKFDKNTSKFVNVFSKKVLKKVKKLQQTYQKAVKNL
jgi:hypothetical protein